MDSAQGLLSSCRQRVQGLQAQLTDSGLSYDALREGLRKTLAATGAIDEKAVHQEEALASETRDSTTDLASNVCIYLVRYHASVLQCLFRPAALTLVEEFSETDLEQFWYPCFGLASRQLVRIVQPESQDATLGFVLVESVMALARALSGRSLQFPNAASPHSLVRSAVHNLLVRAVKHVGIHHFYHSAEHYITIQHQAQQALASKHTTSVLTLWKVFLTHYIGLPDRVANWLAPEAIDLCLRPSEFYQNLAGQLMVWSALESRSSNNKWCTSVHVHCLCLTWAKLCDTKRLDALARALLSDLDAYYLTNRGPQIYQLVAYIFRLLTQVQGERLLRSLFTMAYHAYLKHTEVNLTRCILLIKHLLQTVLTPSMDATSDNTNDDLAAVGPAETAPRLLTFLIRDCIMGGAPKVELLKMWVSFVAELPWHTAALAKDQGSAIDQLFMTIVEEWSGPLFLSRTPTERIHSLTNAFLLTIARADGCDLRRLILSPAMMRGIQQFIECPTSDVRNWGLLVAECMSHRIDDAAQRLTFGLDPKDSTLQQLQALSQYRPAYTAVETQHLQPLDVVISPSQPVNPPTAVVSCDASVEPQLPAIVPLDSIPPKQPHPVVVNPKPNRGSVLPRPVYLRDCLAYLQAQQDAPRFELGLESAAECIKQADPLDLDHMADRLTRQLLTMQNEYNTAEFAPKRHRALTSLVIRCPRKVPRLLAEELFERHYNLDQRTAMLAAISGGIGHLSGLDYDQEQVRSAQAQHQLDQTQQQLAAMQIQHPLALVESSQSPHALGPGKVVRYSRRLELAKAQPASATSATSPSPRFLSLAGPMFFFPLLGGMYSRDSYYDLTREPLLFEHYLRTLNGIIYCAGNAPHIPKMAREYWDLLCPLLVRSPTTANGPKVACHPKSIGDTTRSPAVNVLETALFGIGILLRTLSPTTRTSILRPAEVEAVRLVTIGKLAA
ncbi:TEL2, telomere maintenance protein 2 [Dimargaris verticillata]|uniref:TEL2, telomere maintenance protein 2 n=1 Tax=Dimargaris verticillata TaxID=2761393 RepID=A0A9W8B685_9FUNG|nr:TEL2, telomere maintenance protein 2 [Dimargaris verticillata]